MEEKTDQSTFVRCPLCGNKTKTKVFNRTRVEYFPLYCPKCKHEFIVNIVENKIQVLEPDTKMQSR